MNDEQTGQGWISGWTLTAPPTELYQETACPISVVLTELPGSVVLQTPGACLPLNLTCHGRVSARTGANLLRLVDADTRHDRIASFVVTEASVLLAEMDAELVGELSLGDEAPMSGDEVFSCVEGGHHRIALLMDRRTDPVRLAAIAGTGTPDSMRARAASYLGMSAHALADAAGLPLFPPAPLDYLKSRLRPATSLIPYPWLADAEEEPVWNLAALYPVVLAFLGSDNDVAEALISNVLELMDDEGAVPVAGGNISQPFFGRVSHPLLASLCAAFQRETGRFPGEIAPTINRVIRGLRYFLVPSDDTGTLPAGLLAPLLRSELAAMRHLARMSGRAGEEHVRRIIQELDQYAADADDSTVPPALAPWLTTLAADRRTITPPPATSADDIPAAQPDAAALALLAASHYQQCDYRGYSAWIRSWSAQLDGQWNRALDTGTTPAVRHGTALTGLAGLTESARRHSAAAFNKAKLREQTIIQFVEHRRRWLVGAGITVLVALVAFIISVQMRSTMPRSVYETNIGMVLQFYKTGDYQAALDKLDEMARRGAGENPMLVFHKGKVLFQMGDYPAAIEVFREAVSRRPDNPAFIYNLALSLYRSGQFNEAGALFEDIERSFQRSHPSIAARAGLARKIVEDTARTEQAQRKEP